MLENSPVPLPFVVAKSEVVGSEVVAQHTPRLETAAPPSSVMLPPLLAVVGVLLLMAKVTTVGGFMVFRRPSTGVPWKSLWLKLVLFVARTQ